MSDSASAKSSAQHQKVITLRERLNASVESLCTAQEQLYLDRVEFEKAKQAFDELMKQRIQACEAREEVVYKREQGLAENTRINADRKARIVTLEKNIVEHKAAQAAAEKRAKNAEAEQRRLEGVIADLLAKKKALEDAATTAP